MGGGGDGLGGGDDTGGGIGTGVRLPQMVKPPNVTEPSANHVIVSPATIRTLAGTLEEPLYRTPPMVM
jgi:hypothetical protein